MRKAFSYITGMAALLVCTFSEIRAAAPLGSLWYNGDATGDKGIFNGNNQAGGVGNIAVYDNFIVPASDTLGWNVTALFFNGVVSDVIGSTGSWEIRSGVSSGNGGTLVASGTDALTVTDTGFFNADQGEISELRVTLAIPITLLPGTYWLAVIPNDAGTGQTAIVESDGANAVGSPPGNDGNAFVNSSFYSLNFAPVSSVTGGDNADFSMGVIGAVIPEPASVILLGLGGLICVARCCRQRT